MRPANRAWGGLSPLARGKPTPHRAADLFRGPIPAGAGETRPIASKSAAVGAYPRWRGGNCAVLHRQRHSAGLSPLARGKLARMIGPTLMLGPIPAGAGETDPVS